MISPISGAALRDPRRVSCLPQRRLFAEIVRELLDRHGVDIVELHAGSVDREAGVRLLIDGPRDPSLATDRPISGLERQPDELIRSDGLREKRLRASNRQVDQLAGDAVDVRLHASANLDALMDDRLAVALVEFPFD